MISRRKFREMVTGHPPVSNEELRLLLMAAVEFHLQAEGEVDQEGEGPLMGISPCALISLVYDLLERRLDSGELRRVKPTVEMVQ